MDNSVPTTRRPVDKLLGALSFVPLATGPAAAATDPHRGWLDEINACAVERERVYASCTTAQEESVAEKGPVEAIYKRQDELLTKLTSTEATTPDGLLAQVELLTRDPHIFDDLCRTEHGRTHIAIGMWDSRRENYIKNIHAALTTLATKLGGVS